ncbi:MAG: MFS transporter [Rhizobiales bacterium]|nr:MFS transporter [Hyphomicrobiales bacterium]
MSSVDTSHENGEPASTGAQISWLLYEWANQPYFSLVTIFLFAPYLTQTVIGDAVAGQAYWGYTQAIAGVIIALASPLLGAMADAAGPRKPWILFFTIFCTLGCFGLWFAMPGSPVLPVLVALVIASVGMEFTIIFANAMLPSIASERRLGLLSGIGIGLGQLAAIVALVLVLVFLQLPGQVSAGFIPDAPIFGLSREAFETDRATGPISGIWFLVFMMPLLLFVPDQARSGLSRLEASKAGLIRLGHTISKAWHFRNVALYLISRMAFYDGMNAIFVFGGILAASIFHWGAMEMAIYGLWATFFAALGAFAGGWLDQRFGSKPTLIWALILTILIFTVLISFDHDQLFFFIHVAVPDDAKPFTTLPQQGFLITVAFFGLVAGPTIASSRTMLARIAPVEMMTEFFGLYSLAGKATTFVAPLLIGLVTSLSGSQRIGLMVVMPLIILGIIMLAFVKEERATALEEVIEHEI